MKALACVAVLVACGPGDPPDILGLGDQVAYVGTELVVEINGVDKHGQRLSYAVSSDFDLQNATVTEEPSGMGLFRWTPLAENIGSHAFDFTASNGKSEATVSINIDVQAASTTAPVFRQPLGTGTVVNLVQTPCVMIDIVVDDPDSAQVTLAQDEPVIDGAMFNQTAGLTATWKWCPTSAQVAAADRYTLVLSADDGTNPKTVKPYVIVIGGMAGGPGLVINEVDYDQIGTDSAEYVEIYNPAGSSASLAGVVLVMVNGANNTEYRRVDLSSVSSIGAQQYLVVGNHNVSVPASALHLDPLWTQDAVQNGAPDGIALVDTVTTKVVDALSYEGPLTAATINGFSMPVSLVEGNALDPTIADSNTVSGSLCRMPNGQDTNDAATDWTFCSATTPGTSN